jgi:hypothetical protein
MHFSTSIKADANREYPVANDQPKEQGALPIVRKIWNAARLNNGSAFKTKTILSKTSLLE